MSGKKETVGTGMTKRPKHKDIVEAGASMTDVISKMRALCEQIVGDRRERRMAAVKRMAELWVPGEWPSEERKQAIAERDALTPPEDSELWFAEKILEHLDRAENSRGMGRNEDAEKWFVVAGVNFGVAGMKFEWESITMTGAKVILGGEKGAEVAHGTKQKRKLRDDKLQEAMDAARKRNPTASRAEVRRIVSEETGVSNSTLRRHTIDPIDRGK